VGRGERERLYSFRRGEEKEKGFIPSGGERRKRKALSLPVGRGERERLYSFRRGEEKERGFIPSIGERR
jgi:hypothetical protein